SVYSSPKELVDEYCGYDNQGDGDEVGNDSSHFLPQWHGLFLLAAGSVESDLMAENKKAPGGLSLPGLQMNLGRWLSTYTMARRRQFVHQIAQDCGKYERADLVSVLASHARYLLAMIQSRFTCPAIRERRQTGGTSAAPAMHLRSFYSWPQW